MKVSLCHFCSACGIRVLAHLPRLSRHRVCYNYAVFVVCECQNSAKYLNATKILNVFANKVAAKLQPAVTKLLERANYTPKKRHTNNQTLNAEEDKEAVIG